MSETGTFRLLGSIARKATTNMNQAVSQYQLDNNLFLYLMRIVEHEGITQSELVKLVQVDKTTLSRALAKLAKVGYITRIQTSENRNYKQLFATPKAQKIYPQLSQLEDSYVNEQLYQLSRAERANLETLLGKILHP